MGKMGALLREQKKTNHVYTFTREQLNQRDRMLLEEQKARIMKQMEAEAHKRELEITAKANQFIRDQWAEREELMRAGDNGMFDNLIGYLIAVPCKVLIEHMGWNPIRKDERYRKKMKIDRFCALMLDELNGIAENEEMDIRDYADDVFKKYGVKIEAVEVDE